MVLPIKINFYNSRKVDYIVLHCTATYQDATVEAIFNYWRNVRGWKNPGYHFLIEQDGTINLCQSLEKPSNGVKGNNYNSINIGYIGGVDDNNKAIDNRTLKQKISQLNLISYLKELYPEAKIVGHRDFDGVKKECPSFSVEEWINKVGI